MEISEFQNCKVHDCLQLSSPDQDVPVIVIKKTKTYILTIDIHQLKQQKWNFKFDFHEFFEKIDHTTFIQKMNEVEKGYKDKIQEIENSLTKMEIIREFSLKSININTWGNKEI